MEEIIIEDTTPEVEPQTQSQPEPQTRPEPAPQPQQAESSRGVVNLKNLIRVLLNHKMRFFVNLLLTFVLAAAYILCIPRTYQATVKLAPETTSSSGISSLSNLASSFGFDIGGMQSTDAISPEIYPDLFMSNDFAIKFLSVNVKKKDGSLSTNYYDYLRRHQQQPPWAPLRNWFKKVFTSDEDSKPTTPKAADGKTESGQLDPSTLDPFNLDKKQSMIMEMVTNNIVCSIDKKTDVIVITVTDQDPLIAATMADTARVYLQKFITEYRTSKARVDLEYYKKLESQALSAYQDAIDAYGEYADSHHGDLLESYQARQDELENDMQMRFNNLTALQQQVQNAEAKVQEITPAFTQIQNASVPTKPSGPKRVIFVAFWLFLSFLGTFFWLVRHELLK